MFWPLLTLVADAYPLICPPTSVAEEPGGICHKLVPGCWFSMTTGLLCAAAAGSSPIPATVDRRTLRHADQITCSAVISPFLAAHLQPVREVAPSSFQAKGNSPIRGLKCVMVSESSLQTRGRRNLTPDGELRCFTPSPLGASPLWVRCAACLVRTWRPFGNRFFEEALRN